MRAGFRGEAVMSEQPGQPLVFQHRIGQVLAEMRKGKTPTQIANALGMKTIDVGHYIGKMKHRLRMNPHASVAEVLAEADRQKVIVDIESS